MDGFLTSAVILLAFVVFLGFFNEKVTKFTYEIALMLFSIIIGGVLLAISIAFGNNIGISGILDRIQFFNLEKFLMDGVLCFMLFAGSCHMRLLDFRKHFRAISLLAIGATFLGALFYGTLFYGAGMLLGLKLSFPVCLMFGSITAPTDPIAATSILKKFGLPSNTSFIIEAESLLNDGVGVALFVCFSGLVTAQQGGGFLFVMVKELFGAVLVGLLVSSLCFFVFLKTADETRRIFTSLFAVAFAYFLCEVFGFSGAIASVVCGTLFSGMRNLQDYKGNTMELRQYDVFWEILDVLLNSILYVMLGLSFFNILKMPHVFVLALLAVVINLLGRMGSLEVSTLFMGKIPDGYSRQGFIKLLTWGGLRGGLSVALAMSTRDMLGDDIFYIILGGTYAIVFFTTVVQGMTMQKLYKSIARNPN